MASPPTGHRRHHSAGLLRPLNQSGTTDNLLSKPKNRHLLSSAQPRKRPGSESDILDRPSESSLHHQDSIQLGYHHRPAVVGLKGSSTAAQVVQVKPVYIWTKEEVQKWLRRHAPMAYEKYSTKFMEHETTGRALIALTDTKLSRMGIVEAEIKDEVISEVLKLRLKNHMHCFKGLQSAGMFDVSMVN